MIKKLAKVERAGLGFTDRKILTAHIVVKYEEGLCQDICAFCLDHPLPRDRDSITPEHVIGDRTSRHGTKEGCEFIRRTLEVFNVDDLHCLKGSYLWVLGEGEGLNFKPVGFKPLEVDSNFRKGSVIYADIFETESQHR